ncbi:hypothetical protein [Neobacillus vireti]|uniref:hypothetical protein n=1 Tax=Neobacillus vireti TaxID=220686 RepID=UPI002FFD8C76
MPFFSPNPGRRRFPSGSRPRFGPPNHMGQQPRRFFAPNQNQQAPTSKFNGLGTMMGHVGKVTNGINTLRQMGSILKFFK